MSQAMIVGKSVDGVRRVRGTGRQARTSAVAKRNLAMAAAAVVAMSVNVRAANKYWDTNPVPANSQAGAGDWDAAGGTNWANTANPAANTALTPWVAGSDAFFTTGGVNTVNVIGAVDVNSITNTGGGTSTIFGGAGTLSLGAGGVATSGSNGISVGVGVDFTADQLWKIDSVTTVSAPIGASAFGLRKIGGGPLNLTAANAYTGATTFNGGTVTLSGNGSIAASSGLTISSGDAFATTAFAQPSVVLENGTTNLADRIGGNLTMGLAGKLRLNGKTGEDTNEGIATLAFDTGYAALEINGRSLGKTLQISATSLSRANGATGSVLLHNIGTLTSQSKLALAAPPSGVDLIGAGGMPAGAGTVKNLGIVPWLVAGNNIDVPSNFHLTTYDTTAGSLRRLEDAEYDVINATYATAGNNVTVNAATTLTGADRDLTVNALRLNGSLALTGRAGDTLTISSGALAQSSATSTLGGFGAVTFGNDEGIVHAIGTVNINSPIAVTNGGGLTKAMNGTLVLGADNLYGGTTTVNGGTLQVGTGGTVGNLGASAAVSLNGGNLTINRSDAFTFVGNITGGVTSRDGTSGKFTQAGAGTTTLSGANVIPGLLNVTNGKLVVSGSTTAGGPVHNAITTISSVIGAANNSTVLELTGTGSLTTNNAILKIAEGVNSRSRVYVPAGASLTSGTIMVGNAAGGAGALYQTGGAVSSVQFAEPSLAVGASGGYGFYQQSGGSVSAAARIRIGQGANSAGVYYQTGGSILTQNFDLAGGSGAGQANTGVMYLTGGTFTATGGSNVGYTAGRAEMTIADDAVATANITLSNATNTTSVLNLNDGGTLQSTTLMASGTALGTGFRHVNFDGGTLRYTGATSATQFVNVSPNYAVHVLDGGATFDVVNGTGNATISQPLVTAAGDGVAGTTYAIADGGSGYLGAPVVTITGATGATAVANMVDDGSGNGTFKVASVTVTSPGINASSPSFTFGAVPGATAATPVALSTIANLSGGVTKVGLGTLNLSAANTYAGSTTVSAGKLTLTATGSIDASSGVHVASGATFDVAAKNTALLDGYTVNNLSGAGTVATAAGRAITVAGAGTVAPGDGGVGTLTITGGRIALADGATYAFDAGGTTAAPTGDSIQLTSAGSTALLSGNYTLSLSNLVGGALVPTLETTFVLFDAVAAIAGAGNWTIDYGTTGWTGGQVLLNPLDNTQVILTGLEATAAVPEPTTLAVLGLGATGLLARRRRQQ